MEVLKTDFQDLVVIKPGIFEDERGYFYESFNKQKYDNAIGDIQFIQDNQSKSLRNTIRGLHYQLAPYAQSKLVRVLHGTILDVVVDIRKNSPTYGKHLSIELSNENKLQLFVPKGFAHGFSVLSDSAIVFYKTDNYYHPDSERGINFNDLELNIDWKVNIKDAVVSAKDKVLTSFKEAEKNFNF